MIISSSNTLRGLFDRFVEHLRVPLYRNGYALVLSSALTSGLGIVYWALAARTYDTDAVGLNSAMMSAMTFLASLSQLNLLNALNRFIPSAGRTTKRLVAYAYLISVSVALVTSLIFVWGARVWAPTLGFLGSTPLFVGWFALATAAWCVFALQDGVLTGLRDAVWVPVENLVFALAKIGLLVALAAALPRYGVFASWTVPAVVLLLPVNVLIFRRLIPRHVQATMDRAKPVVVGQIVKYIAGDYTSSLIWMATVNLMPLIVLERVGATANAYFYLSWTIAYSLYLVSRNMGMSLVAEAAADQKKLDVYSFRILVQSARLLAPMVAVIVLGAPWILLLFGGTYAAEGTTLLRLLCLSALPYLVNSLYMSIVRIQRRIGALILVLTSLCVLVLVTSILLMGVYGITGIGIAWLLSQTLVAVVLLFTQLGQLWLPHLNTHALLRTLAIPRRMWQHWSRRRQASGIHDQVPGILSTASSSTDAPLPTTWQVREIIPTVSDLVVVTLGNAGQPPDAVLKLPQTENATQSLQRQRDVLATLQADSRLAEWCAVLPKVWAAGKAAGQSFVIEQLLPGVEARSLLSSSTTCMQVQVAAANTIIELHRETAASAVVGEDMLKRWVDDPLMLLGRASLGRAASDDRAQVIDRLASELRQALIGRTFAVSWVHGDYAPRNILVTPDGSRVTGIVDWDLASPDGLPQLDIVHLFLSTRMLTQHLELGDIVRGLLDGDGWTAREQALLDAQNAALPGAALELRELVLLSWLRHIGANLTKSTRYPGHRLWAMKNIENVLRCV